MLEVLNFEHGMTTWWRKILLKVAHFQACRKSFTMTDDAHMHLNWDSCAAWIPFAFVMFLIFYWATRCIACCYLFFFCFLFFSRTTEPINSIFRMNIVRSSENLNCKDLSSSFNRRHVVAQFVSFLVITF